MTDDDREALESAARRLGAGYNRHRADLQSDLRWAIGHGRLLRNGLRATIDQGWVSGGLDGEELEALQRALAGVVLILRDLYPIGDYPEGESA